MFELKNGYFQNCGVNIMAFDDVYPEGHQSGVSIVMNGNRIATNGDLRFEPTPGQWQPVPKQGTRKVNKNEIVTNLSFPDESRHLKGFNPMIYPNIELQYKVTVRGEKEKIIVSVDLEKPVPQNVFFNLELFPGVLMGKPWIMDDTCGIFPHQPNGPVLTKKSNYPVTENYSPIIADDMIAEPYAVGRSFTVRPDDPLFCFRIEAKELKLYDGRMNHNNGWFVISSEILTGEKSIEWVITPTVVENWLYTPVIQISQVGYHPSQTKKAVIELDERDTKREKVHLYKITAQRQKEIFSSDSQEWGKFLRYNYLLFDFSEVKDEGLYKITYGTSETSVFRISRDIYERGIWQPVLEYFLPVQMCHMRVSEKYRVWHGLCHNDDARMAPINHNHFDGYVQSESTLTKYNSGDTVEGLNVGGWHDAGDFDIRIESQSGEIYALSLAYEEFNIFYDTTSIDQEKKICEIHQPDGKNDILQQIEHGTLSIVNGYFSLGKLYRGIICNDLRQYVLLGDSAAMTDGIQGNADDRWVFTENNPTRELTTAAHLAAASRALKNFNEELSKKALQAACEIYENTSDENAKAAKIHAATELFLTTGENKYRDYIQSETDFITKEIESIGWIVSRVISKNFLCEIKNALSALNKKFTAECAETPYGIPYKPHIWGAGWGIQRLGFQYYFLHKAFPEIFNAELIFNALNFVLGCHPGSNTASFASGVGAKSATVGYGLNRADWSYIPGGVISGTALIRPDFPELLEFPYLWQQTEYLIGGGSSHYMFLVLAVKNLT